MTRFNPNRKHKTPEEWTQEAYKVTSQNNLQFHVIGGLALSILVAGATTPVTGGLIAVYTLWTAWTRSGEIQRNQSAIIDAGCVAQVLEHDDFLDYLGQVGPNAVITELTYAKNRGLTLSNDALDYLEDSQYEQCPLSIPNSDRTGELHPIAPHRQLETSTVETYNPNLRSQVDIISEMCKPIGNFFIVGLGGSGKGMLLANALREVKRLHPDRKIFLINGKDSPKERGYFEGVVDVHKVLHCETAKPQTVAAWFEACIAEYNEFAVTNNGALLVIDEGTIIGARLKAANSTMLGDKIIGITSCGGDTGKNIWFVAQTPFVGANGSDLSGISQLTPIAIVSKSNLAVLDAWKSARLFKKFNSDEIAEFIQQSDCDRAVYFGKTALWYSMPELTNYSGYNRDTRTYLPGYEPESSIEVATNIDAVTKLENSFKGDIDQQDAVTVTDLFLDHVIQVIEASDKNCLSANAIRNSRMWSRDWGENNPTIALIKEALNDLIKLGKVIGNEGTGFSLSNKI